MIPFPSIKQYRNVVKTIRDRSTFVGKDNEDQPIFDLSKPCPVIRYSGTVKLHGTNAGIVFQDGKIQFQSRTRIITPDDDNAGFAGYMSKHLDFLETIRECIGVAPYNTVTVYGEWCGEGIQKGVAINRLPKMFVIFAININGFWRETLPVICSMNIYTIDDFYKQLIDIDFNKPKEIQNQLIEYTNQVEACCPVGKAFGVNGTGEGIVWKPIGYPNADYWFKVKGEKHSSTHVKVLSQVDTEVLKRIQDFVDYAVAENRLMQGLDYLKEYNKPFDMTSMGDYLRWISNDVTKEEMDTIEANELDPRQVNKAVTAKAKQWFTNKLNESVGLRA